MDKKRTASLPVNVFPNKGSFSNFSMLGADEKEFKPVEQFRNSLNEVTTGQVNNRILNHAAHGSTPN